MNRELFAISPGFGDCRIYRTITFDRQAFDALMEAKRSLNEYWGRDFKNSEVIRALILSHSFVRPALYQEAP